MTLTTEQLRERAAAYRTDAATLAELGDTASSQRLNESANAFDELAANREAQPVGYIAEVSGNRVGVLRGLPLPDAGSLIYTAPPAPAVPGAISTRQAIVKMESHEPCGSINVAYKLGWNACRAAMLQNSASGEPSIDAGLMANKRENSASVNQPVSSGYKLPDNVREALTLALQAMEFMGDTLNNIDAVCTEDVEYVTPAFNAVRELLAAAPEGGNDHDTRR
ncbi:TPA: hypothetical protein SML71_002056 [Serratia marcescens]|nr:hypothetical protein [Serratia marcescens]